MVLSGLQSVCRGRRWSGVVFDLSITKLLVLAVLALVIFGPDQLPKIASQAGRMLRDLRRMAEGAKADLQDGLGPEFADFDINDLNPRNFVRKHLLDDPEDADVPGSRPREVPCPIQDGEHRAHALALPLEHQIGLPPAAQQVHPTVRGREDLDGGLQPGVDDGCHAHGRTGTEGNAASGALGVVADRHDGPLELLDLEHALTSSPGRQPWRAR